MSLNSSNAGSKKSLDSLTSLDQSSFSNAQAMAQQVLDTLISSSGSSIAKTLNSFQDTNIASEQSLSHSPSSSTTTSLKRMANETKERSGKRNKELESIGQMANYKLSSDSVDYIIEDNSAQTLGISYDSNVSETTWIDCLVHPSITFEEALGTFSSKAR